MALRSGTGVRCARMSSAVLPVAFTAARAASSSSDVEPDADDHVHGPAGLGAHLDEDAAELAAAR